MATRKLYFVIFVLAGLVFGLSIIVFILNLNVDSLSEKLRIAQEENNRQAEEMRVELFNLKNLSRENELLRRKDVSFLELRSTKTKGHLVRVFHDQSDGQVYLSVVKMAPLTKGQYQLWNVKGKQFEDLGTLEAGLKGLQKLKKTKSVNQLVITEEPIGGSQSPSPTLW